MQRSTSQCATELRHLRDGRVELPSEGLRIAAECVQRLELEPTTHNPEQTDGDGFR
jgi:hypothetical protein